ncbi:hypothetical protein [Streptomyces sp. NPDC002851]
MASAPKRQIGTALGWFWFSFTLGLPTPGSLLAASLIPAIGAYPTLWLSLGLILVGSAIALTLLRDRAGFQGLLPPEQRAPVIFLWQGAKRMLRWESSAWAGGACAAAA